jgi:hypothetical protein
LKTLILKSNRRTRFQIFCCFQLLCISVNWWEYHT